MTIGVSTGEQYEDEFQYYVQSMQTEEGLPFFQLQEPGLDREGGLDQLKRKREQQDDFDAGVMRTLRPGKEVPDALPGMIINPKDMELMKSLGKEASLNDPSIMSDAPTMTAAREGFDWLHYTTSIRPSHDFLTLEERDMSVPLRNYDIKNVGPTDPSISAYEYNRGAQAWGNPRSKDGDEDVRVDLATVNPMDPFSAAAERVQAKHPTRFYESMKPKDHLSNMNWEFVGKYLLHKLGQTAESAKNVFQAPYKAYKGELDPKSPEAIKAMFDLASTMVFAPMPIARKMVDGTLGSFAGVKANTLNKKNFERAVVMDRKGHTPNEIWEETGMFRLGDDQWRFEISGQAQLSTVMPKKGKLSDYYIHPELYEAYPYLKDIKIEMVADKKLPNSWAVFHPGTNTIKLAPAKILKEGGSIQETIAHEIQHSIQKQEGFVTGGASLSHISEKLGTAIERKADEFTYHRNMEGLRELAEISSQIAANKDNFVKYLYLRDPGEFEANLAAYRSKYMFENERLAESPMDTAKRQEIVLSAQPDKQYPNQEFRFNEDIEPFGIEGKDYYKLLDKDIQSKFFGKANLYPDEGGIVLDFSQKIKFDRFDTYERKGVQHYGLEFNKTYKLENIVDNKELFKKYPELRKIKVVRAADEGMYHFDAEKNTLHIGVMDSDTLYNALADVVQQKTASKVNPQQIDKGSPDNIISRIDNFDKLMEEKGYFQSLKEWRRQPDHVKYNEAVIDQQWERMVKEAVDFAHETFKGGEVVKFPKERANTPKSTQADVMIARDYKETASIPKAVIEKFFDRLHERLFGKERGE